MKYTIRKTFGDWLIYGFITRIQPITGLTSKLQDTNKQLLLWDFDNLPLKTVYIELTRIYILYRNKYNIDGISIFSDKDGSYRALSITQIDFRDLIKVLVETDGVDFNFFKWTVKRGYATIRISNKEGRALNNQVISTIGNPQNITDNKKLIFVGYTTDMD